VQWDVTRSVKIRFDEEGICVPFPRRDVRVVSSDAGARTDSPSTGALDA
jgi:small conductance mechanosensitive channel